MPTKRSKRMTTFVVQGLKRCLVPRHTPDHHKVILTGPQGIGKSMMLFQMLSQYDDVLYLNALDLLDGRHRYYYKDGDYYHEMASVQPSTVVGIDNINAFLHPSFYRSIQDTRHRVHPFQFATVRQLMMHPRLIGAECRRFFPSQHQVPRTLLSHLSMYNEIEKYTVPPLTKTEMAEHFPVENLGRIAMLTGGNMRDMQKIKCYERYNAISMS